MIPYMVGKLAPNSSYLTRGLVKDIPGRGYFRAVPSQKGDKYVTSPPPPIVELVEDENGSAILMLYVDDVILLGANKQLLDKLKK